MSADLSIMFDENIGRPLVTALARLLAFDRKHNPSVQHLLDYVGRHGEDDDVWIPKLVAGDWIVVTADLGRRAGVKLPRICRESGVRHVLISGTLHNARQFQKARAIVMVWPDLVQVASAPRGARFKLQLRRGQPVLINAG